MKLGQLRRKKDGGVILQKVFKAAIKDAQPCIMKRIMPNSIEIWMDRGLTDSGDLLIGDYWTKLVTHTSMKGLLSGKKIEMVRQMRSRRMGFMHDRSWPVMQNTKGGETENMTSWDNSSVHAAARTKLRSNM